MEISLTNENNNYKKNPIVFLDIAIESEKGMVIIIKINKSIFNVY